MKFAIQKVSPTILAIFLLLACNNERPSSSDYRDSRESLPSTTPAATSSPASEVAPNNYSYQIPSEQEQVGSYSNYSPEATPNESYSKISENGFKLSKENPLSTFSIDVDRASYSNVRRFLSHNSLPPANAVRIEEMVNYFHYDYPEPRGKNPFSINTELSDCPWNTNNKLLHVGLKGKTLSDTELPPSNLVFLLDVSGSMSQPNKLPLLKSAFKLMIQQLDARDRVSIVVYAGASGLVLAPTPGNQKRKIMKALDRLQAGGGTAGGEGIELAYRTAKRAFLPSGNNRVILATDGDFNIGVNSVDDLVSLIEEKRKSGVFLSVLGFGTGNYKDHEMEQLANKGNGNYAYIDNIREAKKVLVHEIRSTLHTIAKDVKIQVEFNPANVQAYRLIGYENRLLAKEDFNDDTKDAGEIGAGHTVTALYEIVPKGAPEVAVAKVDKLKYQYTNTKIRSHIIDEWLTVKLRYKEPKESQSKYLDIGVRDEGLEWQNTSENFRFSAAVAGFGMLLRNSQYKEGMTFENVESWALESMGDDLNGYRSEFIELVGKANVLSGGVASNNRW